MDNIEVCALGDYALQEGGLLRGAQITFKTHGTLDANRTNAILFPTHYGGTHLENEWLIGPARALDTDRYFIIVPNMLGNGVTSSPSNTADPYGKSAFPHVTVYDNVELQHRLLVERLGITRLALVLG